MNLKQEHKDHDIEAWLAQQGVAFKKTTQKLVIVSSLLFSVRVGALYLLAVIVAEVVIRSSQPTVLQTLCLFAVLLLQILFQAIVNRNKLALSQQALDHFYFEMQKALMRGGLAVVRDYTTAAWQSFFLNRLPALQAYYAEYIPQKYLAAIAPVIVLSVVLPFSWLVALLLLLSAPLVPLFMWVVGMGAARVHRQHFVALERLSGIFLDRLKARNLIQQHRQVVNQSQLFDKVGDNLRDRTLKVVSSAFLSAAVLDFFSTLAIAMVAVFIGFSLLGEITVGSWSAGLQLQEGLFVLLLCPLFFSELKSLGRLYHSKSAAVGAADALCDILLTDISEKATCSLPLTVSNLDVAGRVKASRLVIEPGDRIWLQGVSGAGKSTLLEALLGYRKCESQDTQALLNPAEVAWLTQEPVIVSGSVRHNLCLGKEFDLRQLTNALEKVELLDWLYSLEHSWDTVLGDYPPMSEGQKQRLALARILLFEKPVVFLDEPTAHLGYEQGCRIRRLIQGLLADKTLVWVSHDPVGDNYFSKIWKVNHQGEVVQETLRELQCA